jgi:hypothetical protein
LLYIGFKTIIDLVYLYGVFDLLLCLLDDLLEVSVDAFYFLTPTLQLQRFTCSCLSLVIVDIVFYNSHVDFIP